MRIPYNMKYLLYNMENQYIYKINYGKKIKTAQSGSIWIKFYCFCVVFNNSLVIL